MTAISDLPNVLLEEILSRVPITSLRAMRSTCKLWNTLFKDPSPVIFDKASKEITFVLMYDFRACLLSVNLHDHEDDLVCPFIKEIGKLQQIRISNVFHCNGLLLCLTHCPSLMVWNPYLGQTRWIDPRTDGYSTGIHCYGMGYDNNNNHKILRVSYWNTHINCEIYDFKSPSWRRLGIKMDWNICGQGVSLKGNNYFIARKRIAEEPLRNCIICFDFTREIFWGLPPLPCDSRWVDLDALSVVSEEKLAVLCRRIDRWEIWITDKIDSNAVSWSYFLNVDHIPSRFYSVNGSFFVDEQKKIAVICVLDLQKRSYKACMVGEGEHYREWDLKEYNYQSCMCSLYVPSLMWIE